MENELKAAILAILLSFAIGIWAFPVLPALSVTHWGADGEPNGYLPAFWAAFLLPLIMAALLLLLLTIPIVDPLRENIALFRKDFYGFALVIELFMLVVYAQSILWNLGTQISFSLTMPFLFGALFIYIGFFLEKTKPNWFIGIRTPWTLSSPEVWEKTHKLGGKLFKAAGVLSVISVLFPAYVFWVVIAVVIAAAIATVIYSYIAYSKLGKKEKPEKKKLQ